MPQLQTQKSQKVNRQVAGRVRWNPQSVVLKARQKPNRQARQFGVAEGVVVVGSFAIIATLGYSHWQGSLKEQSVSSFVPAPYEAKSRLSITEGYKVSPLLVQEGLILSDYTPSNKIPQIKAEDLASSFFAAANPQASYPNGSAPNGSAPNGSVSNSPNPNSPSTNPPTNNPGPISLKGPISNSSPSGPEQVSEIANLFKGLNKLANGIDNGIAKGVTSSTQTVGAGVQMLGDISGQASSGIQSVTHNVLSNVGKDFSQIGLDFGGGAPPPGGGSGGGGGGGGGGSSGGGSGEGGLPFSSNPGSGSFGLGSPSSGAQGGCPCCGPGGSNPIGSSYPGETTSYKGGGYL